MSQHMRIIDVRGRGLAGQELTTIRPTGSDEEYITYRTTPKRYLEIDFEIRAKNKEDLRKKIDEINGFIETKEKVPIVFSDEPDMRYYGELESIEEDRELHHIGIHRGTIFILRDNYKYGQEKQYIIDGPSILENEGTATVKPVFELTATQKSTFAMISDGEQYNLIGRPAPADEIASSHQELIMHDNCQSTSGWTTADEVDNGSVTGSIKPENGAFVVDSIGSGSGWIGPSIKRDIGATLENMRFAAEVELLNTGNKTGMIEFYFLNNNDDVIFKIGIEDVYEHIDEVQGKFQTREAGNDNIVNHYVKADNRNMWNSFKGVLQVFVDNGYIRPYFALVMPNGSHNYIKSAERFIWTGLPFPSLLRVSQVQVALRNYAGTSLATMRVKDIKVWRYNPYEGIPYILDEGDVVTFDHVNDDLLINGEPRNDLKNFGGSFFSLKKGQNTIVVSPQDAFNATVKFRERYR